MEFLEEFFDFFRKEFLQVKHQEDYVSLSRPFQQRPHFTIRAFECAHRKKYTFKGLTQSHFVQWFQQSESVNWKINHNGTHQDGVLVLTTESPRPMMRQLPSYRSGRSIQEAIKNIFCLLFHRSRFRLRPYTDWRRRRIQTQSRVGRVISFRWALAQ